MVARLLGGVFSTAGGTPCGPHHRAVDAPQPLVDRPGGGKRTLQATENRVGVPSPFHWSNPRHAVFHVPTSSGRSRQGDPLRSTHKMPSSTRRGSHRGRPVPAAVRKW